ncbi:MAG: NosR/NirI family nitrous oxide reductase transcriptional regulator [Verrucomicrobiales bacterium]|jgi:NosR/NirI family nitrous oxide reductase transcriptional regulator
MLDLKRIRPFALRVYRLAVLVLIVLLVRTHHARLRLAGDRPITLPEVREMLGDAVALGADDSTRQGLVVYGPGRILIGYAVRTAPHADAITGYSGPADTLVVFDADERVVAIRLRHSYDTPNHISDVVMDYPFMESWNGMSWQTIAEMNLKKAGVEGVSGATRTSMCMAEGLVYRMRLANAEKPPPPAFRVAWADVAMLITLLGGLAMTFLHFKRKKTVRRIFQVFVFVYIGLIQGDLLAQSLLRGWAESGIPWRFTPGLVLLAAAALVVPWATRRPMYCGHICPHGAAQEWLGKLVKRKPKLPHGLLAGLKAIPLVLIGWVLVTSLLAMPLDVAGLEPFDAYLFKTAGIATLSVALVGLVFSLFVPMAYCKYGCPTGAVLGFVRSHGGADHFRPADGAAGCLVMLTLFVFLRYDVLMRWLMEASSL